MSTSPKQSNVPNFQTVDIKGTKHRRQENVTKSRIATKSSRKSRYHSESWLVKSSGRENSIAKDDVQEPTSHGKQTNLFYRSLQETSWYQPSSSDEERTYSDSQDEESKESEVNTSGFSGTPILQVDADKAGAHGYISSSLGQLKPTQKKRSTAWHSESIENSYHVGNPRFSSTELTQSSTIERRKNVRFGTKQFTFNLMDGGDRTHHQRWVPDMLRMGEEESEDGESWYDHRLVSLPTTSWQTGRSSHGAGNVKFDEYAEEYPVMKMSLRRDQRVGSRKLNVERPDTSGSGRLKDLTNHQKSFHSMDENLSHRVDRKSSSIARHCVALSRMRVKDHDASESESNSYRKSLLRNEGNEGQFVKNWSISKQEEVDTKFLPQEYDDWLPSPNSADFPTSLHGGSQRPSDDEYATPLRFTEKGKKVENSHYLKGESDLKSSLQNVDSVQDLLLQYKDSENYAILFGMKGFHEEHSKLTEPETFNKAEVKAFGEHYDHSVTSQLGMANGAMLRETGLDDKSFNKMDPGAFEDQFLSSEYRFDKDVKQSRGKQDFVTSQEKFPSQLWSPQEKVKSRRLGEQDTVEKMVSDVILSQSEVMSQMLESSLNSSKSPRPERSNVSWDAGNSSVPCSTVSSSRQVRANSLRFGSISSCREPSLHEDKLGDSVAEEGHIDHTSLSFPDLATQNQREMAEHKHQFGIFSTYLESEGGYNAERASDPISDSVDSSLLFKNPPTSSIKRTRDISTKDSMQMRSVFQEKHSQPKSATSKSKHPIQKIVLSEESQKVCEGNATFLHPNSEVNHLPQRELDSNVSQHKSIHRKSVKKSLKFEVPSKNSKPTVTVHHNDHEASLQDEPLVLSGHSGCLQERDVSIASLKFNSKSSKFVNGKFTNKFSKDSNNKIHQQEAAFQEERSRELRHLGEIDIKDNLFPEIMKSAGDSFSSEKISVKGNDFPSVSIASEFTQSLHLSELGDLDAGEQDPDYDAVEIRGDEGEKQTFHKGSHVVDRLETDYQQGLQKTPCEQRGQYDKSTQHDKRTVMENETKENGLEMKRTFHHEVISSSASKITQRHGRSRFLPPEGYDNMGQYGSRTLLHDLSGDLQGNPVRNAYSLPPVADSTCDTDRSNVSKKIRSPSKKSLKTESKQEKREETRSEQTGMLSSLHSRTDSPQRSLLQDVTLLSGIGWTVRVRNVLREIPKTRHGEMVSKAYWLKRWRIATRVQKMLQAEAEGQMQSAILFHEVTLLHKYLTAWKRTTREKQHRASQFYQKYLLHKGMRALQNSVKERETKVKYLVERSQQGQLRSSFQKWQMLAQIHQEHGMRAVRYSDRNQLAVAFHKWTDKFGFKQKERIANLHYKLHLLSLHFAKWKIYVSDRKVRQEQNELARVFLEENTLQASWDTLKMVYHKRVAAQQQDRRCLLAKVITSWKHRAKLSRLETIEDHRKAQEFRRASLQRTYLSLWREGVAISQAKKKLEVVTLRYAFGLWKLKLERKKLVARIVASKLRRATKLRVLSVWWNKTRENRDRRLEGTKILQTFLLKRLFRAWKMVIEKRRENCSKALLWGHQSHLRKKMQLFTSWRRRTHEKQQVRLAEEHRKQLLVEKFAVRWRQVVKVKQDEVKVQTFQEKRRIVFLKVAFSRWLAAFDQTVEDQQRVKEAQETLAQNKLHRTFLSWRLAAREGAVIKPLVEKRRLKKMSSIFTSWRKIARDKKTAQQMCEQKKQRRLALAYCAWRQQHLAVLQQRIVMEAHGRNHLQRVFRAWQLVVKRRKLAEKFSQGCKKEMLKRSFSGWKEKTEEREMKKDIRRGNEAKEIVSKKACLRHWLRKIREQRNEEAIFCVRISVMHEKLLIMAAFSEWKKSCHRERQAREYRKAATNRKLVMILNRWHQHAKYSFQRSLELFTRSLQITSPGEYSEMTSEISKRAAASESSYLSEMHQCSVVDSGYHGNHAPQVFDTLDVISIHATSEVVSGAELTDADIMSYQSFKTFSEENDNSVYSPPRHNGTVMSDEISYVYSSRQSFMQMECASGLGETILSEGEDSIFPNSDAMSLSIFETNNNADNGNSINDDYMLTEEELVSSVIRNEFYQQPWNDAIKSQCKYAKASSEPGASMEAFSSSSSSEAGASSLSSHHLCTVMHQSLGSNVLRDIWLREAGEIKDGDSTGEMSLRELEELDEEDGKEGGLLQEDGEVQGGAVLISKVELLTYMINFWRLWPASAAFLQWLSYTKYRRIDRWRKDYFTRCFDKRRLQTCLQLWKKRYELAAIARHHQETVTLRKHFNALRNCSWLQKKQREDGEIARRWRCEKSLRETFDFWRLQFLKSHSVGGIAPTWEQHKSKSRLLQLRAADWTQMLQKKNVQECLMFWKLRHWQQVQVRAHHERILKLRHFKAWLDWIQVKRWRCIQQERFLHQRQKSLALARWREALHEKSKVEMMRSKVNQNHLKEIFICWHLYCRITQEDRVRTDKVQHMVNEDTLRQYWCIWRDHLSNVMKAKKHRNDALVKRSFVNWSEWTQGNVTLRKAVIQFRSISQEQILKSSFVKWQQRLESKRKLALFVQKQELSLVKVYFMRWKEFVQKRRQEVKRQREVVTQWISICTHGQKTRHLAQWSLHRWHQLVIRSRHLSSLGHEITKRQNDRCLQTFWRKWKDASQKLNMARAFWENSSKKGFFTRWSCFTQERKESLTKLHLLRTEHEKRLVAQHFQTWRVHFLHLQSKGKMENQFRAQRSQRLLAVSFQCWIQKFWERKAERYYQMSLERKVWIVWQTSLAQTQKIKQFKEDCLKKQLQATFERLQKWTSDQRTRQKLVSDCLEKRDMKILKETFESWKRQTNRLQQANDVYQRNLLKQNLRAWSDFHRKQKQLKLLTVEVQERFSFNRFMQTVSCSEWFLSVDSVKPGKRRDASDQRLKICFKLWKMKSSVRDAERQRVKMLTQKVVDRWRQMVEIRRYERQVEDDLEELAGKYHSQRLRRAMFMAWRQEAWCQRRKRKRQKYLSQKYANLWMRFTSQRIIAEQMDRYWILKRRWIRWRKVMIQSKVSKKFLEEDEARLCLEVLESWKNAAQCGTLSEL